MNEKKTLQNKGATNDIRVLKAIQGTNSFKFQNIKTQRIDYLLLERLLSLRVNPLRFLYKRRNILIFINMKVFILNRT